MPAPAWAGADAAGALAVWEGSQQQVWRQTLHEVKHVYAVLIDGTCATEAGLPGALASSWAGNGPNAVCKDSADTVETG